MVDGSGGKHSVWRNRFYNWEWAMHLMIEKIQRLRRSSVVAAGIQHVEQILWPDDKAPAAVVGLVGHKEYEQCAKDLYYFIQSSVCMKQLVLDLLELLLLSAFPELTSVFNTLHEEKFGELIID
ncbi:hypothetical protein K7X08_013536 [Anisodus acutangulus]|uniref:Uncharacterized protein n=1 Tax=Anisodus acutangulus TaxID=402998 RepID=A0A9Q1LNX5_9SOLA|nr:hypothetical protein K7X08_013536 [Anisodus acutangulus]